MSSILEIKNLNKSFKKKHIIKDLSMNIEAGEVFGFLGPNGAGKTTTIKMVMGFLFPDSGEIYINGYDLKKDYEKAMSFLGGIVENPEMYKNLTGMTNLKMYARLHENVDKNRIEEVVQMVGMSNWINEKISKYSLGMKQRVGLAQALLHKPKLLILDEPTNGLDPNGIRELRDILKKVAHEDGVAVMVSSHLLSEMELMCDRVGIINHGELKSVNTVEELIAQVSGGSKYTIGTKQVKEAKELLDANYPNKINKVFEDKIVLEIEEEEVSKIIVLLTENKIMINGVNKTEISLEEAFLNTTGGGTEIE